MKYNAAFFGLYENLFLVLKNEFGKKTGLELFRKVIEKGLKKAFDSESFTKGNPADFVRVVGKRDKSVGLKVKFPLVSKNKIVYRFLSDPFPNLKGKVSAKELDATYMDFKVNYLLGKNWGYKTTRHLWNKDGFTEHVIEKAP